MFGVIIVIHVLVCLILIGVVLLQQGKGADMGAVFGGSSSTVFGSGGAGNFLTRLTTICAAVFMLTSVALTYIGASKMTSTVFDSALPEPPPLEVPAAPEPGAAAPAPAGEAAPAPAPEPEANAPAQQPAPAEQKPQDAVPGAGAAAAAAANEAAMAVGGDAAPAGAPADAPGTD